MHDFLSSANLFSKSTLSKKNFQEYHQSVKQLGYRSGLTRGVQYVMKSAQYIPKFYIYTLHNYFHKKVCFLAK